MAGKEKKIIGKYIKEKTVKKFQLALVFASIVSLILFITMLFIFAVLFILSRLGKSPFDEGIYAALFLFALISLVIGTLMAFLLSHVPLGPIHVIGQAADKIASGDFNVRIKLKGPYEIVRLGERFNHMAEELGSVEILRSDFVNSFSHEFKTPIVSIRGFAKMLKNPELTPEERSEYLDIIINESERLSDLATNVLNLSRVERQTILSETKRYNVSEQIRRVIAMMYGKWQSRRLEFTFDSGEFYVTANEELLKQVWINLFDNAVKFSPGCAEITVDIREEGGFLCFTIADKGIGMDEKTAARVFDKFYQGDISRSTKGNGLGLTAARRIVELHGGQIEVSSRPGEGSCFTVTLPLF